MKINSDDGTLAITTESAQDNIRATLYYTLPIETIAAAAGIKISGKDLISTPGCTISAASGCEIMLNV